MSDRNRDGGRRPPGNEDEEGRTIRELADLQVEVRSGFLRRVRRRIDRRMVTSQLLSASWHVPAAILLEFLGMIFGLFGFDEPREGGSR